MERETLIPLAAAVLAILIVAFVFAGISGVKQAKAMARRWAEKNGYRLIEARICLIRPLPFWGLGYSKSQVYLAVRVLDNRGDERRAWLVCGGYFFSLLSEHVEVEWRD